jgi:hypothetical protein
MAVAENIRFHRAGLADDALGRIAAAVDRGLDSLDNDVAENGSLGIQLARIGRFRAGGKFPAGAAFSAIIQDAPTGDATSPPDCFPARAGCLMLRFGGDYRRFFAGSTDA